MRHHRYPVRHGLRGGRNAPEDGMPRPEAPADPKPGAYAGRIIAELYGKRFEVELRVPGDEGQRRARSDHLAAEIDGEWRRVSLRAALLELDRMVPRVMSRKERAGL